MSDKRTEILATRVSEREARVIEEMAEKEDISVSNFIRSRLFPDEKSLRLLSSSQPAMDVK